MKKICFFMNTPFNLGGEQRIVTVLANYLVNNGFDITFLLTNDSKKIDRKLYNMDDRINIIFITEINKFGFKLKRKILSKLFSLNSYTGIFKNNLSVIKKLYCTNSDKEIITKYLENEQFDYVIGIGSLYYGKLARIMENLSIKTKSIAWEHNCFKAYFETKGIRFYNQDIFVKYILKNIDLYVVQTSDDLKKIYEKFNYIPIKINNPNTFINYRMNTLKNKRFIAAGRFSDVKNFSFLIDAFNLFNKQNNEWKLYIYGDGEYYKKCAKKIKKYNLENKVFLPGKVSNIDEKYLESSIFLISSLWEGWGMVVTEAMQHGLPIISTDLPSTREIFENYDCGIIVKSLNIKEYANAMLKLVKDDSYIDKMENCIERVKCFDINVIGKKWIEILK